MCVCCDAFCLLIRFIKVLRSAFLFKPCTTCAVESTFPLINLWRKMSKPFLFNRGDLLGVDGLAEIQKIIYSVLILPLSNTHISGKPHSSYLMGGTCTYPGNNMSTALSICQIPSCCLTHSLD